MNTILEKNYSHLTLFRLYIYAKGRTSQNYSGNLQSEIQQLLGDEYNIDYRKQ